jgi:hypothetical protein
VSDEAAPLETGWRAETPVGDSLMRRFVIGFAEWIESSARAAGQPMIRTDDIVAVDERSPHVLLNSGILLRPVTPERAPQILADLVGLYSGSPGGPFSVFCPWPTDIVDVTIGGHPPVMLRTPGGEAPPTPPGLEVVEVTTPEQLAEYERVLVDGFPLEELRPWQSPTALHPSMLHLPGMPVDEFGAGLAHEVTVTAQVTADVHGRTEFGEAICFQRLDDLRVEVQLFGRRRDRQAGAFTAGTQTFADRTRRGRRRGNCRLFHRTQLPRLSARACSESGNSRRSVRENFSSLILSLAARATVTAAYSTSASGRKAPR